MLVVLYHLVPDFAPGGYIGVDVFFVVSGFLISGHLIAEVRETGKLRILAFWGKRIRRLLPSAFVVLVATFIGVIAFLPVEQWRANFLAIVGSAGYVVNWVFAANSVNYMNAEDSATATQQFWSLAVEEQYYFVWPLLIIAVVWLASRFLSSDKARFASVRIALVVAFLGSLAWSIHETATNQPFAYFSTATRVWEFAAGALISLPFRSRRLARGLPQRAWKPFKISLSWLGLILIAWAGLSGAFSAATPYPGYQALLPVLGTVLIIAAGDSNTRWEPAYLAKFGPISGVATLSYAIYLWHWPAVIFYPFVTGQELDAKGVVIVAVLTVLLAWATKKIVEDPVRFRPGFARVAPTLAIVAGGMAGILLLGMGGVFYLGSASTYGASQNTAFQDVAAVTTEVDATLDGHAWSIPAEPSLTPIWTADGCLTVDSAAKIETCTFGDRSSTKTVVVLGDSVATTWMPGIINALEPEGWRVVALTMEQCPAVDVEVFKFPTFAPYSKCDEHRSWAIDQLAQLAPQLVVVASAGEESQARFMSQATGTAADDEWGSGMASYLKKVAAVSPHVVVLGNPPVPNCLKENRDPSTCAPDAEPLEQERVAAELKANQSAGTTYVDTRRWFCNESMTLCPVQVGYGLVRVDNTHLTDEYARRLGPILRDRLDAVAGG